MARKITAPRFVLIMANLLGLALIIHNAVLVHRYYLPAPWFDLWLFVPDLERFTRGIFTFHDLIKQHYEHRIATTRVFLLIDAVFFNFTGRFVEIADFVLFIVLGAAFAALWRTRALRAAGAVAPTLVVIAAACSLSQWFNMVSAFQIQFVLTCLFVLGAARALVAATVIATSPTRQAVFVGLAGLSALLATFSMAAGTFALPALGVLLWLRRAPAAIMLGFAACAGAILIAFVHGYQNGAYLSWAFMLNPSLIPYRLLYACGFLGSAVAVAGPFAFIGGALLLAGFTVAAGLYVTDRVRHGTAMEGRLAVCLALGLWAASNAAASAIARSMMGLDTAVTSRYATMSIVFGLTTFILVSARLASIARLRRYLPALVLGGLLTALAIMNVSRRMSSDMALRYDGSLQHAQLIQQNVRVQGAMPILFIGTVDDIVAEIRFLHTHHLSLFAPENLAPANIQSQIATVFSTGAAACRGHIDAIFAIDARRFAANGWIADPVLPRTPEWVGVADQNAQVIAIIRPSLRRPDLDAALRGGPGLAGFDMGFGGTVPADPARRVRFAGVFNDGTACVLPGSMHPGPPPADGAPGLGMWSARAAALGRARGTTTDWAAIY